MGRRSKKPKVENPIISKNNELLCITRTNQGRVVVSHKGTNEKIASLFLSFFISDREIADTVRRTADKATQIIRNRNKELKEEESV